MARDSTISRRTKERIAWLQAGAASHYDRLTEHQRYAVIRLLEEGATLVEIAALEGMPSASSVYREARENPQFADAVQAARAACAATAIEEAQAELREAAAGNDTDRMSIANAYQRGTLEYAAKIAPREFGQLVKLAGADGGALTVNLVNYGTGNSGNDTDSLARDKAIALQAAQVSATPESQVQGSLSACIQVEIE